MRELAARPPLQFSEMQKFSHLFRAYLRLFVCAGGVARAMILKRQQCRFEGLAGEPATVLLAEAEAVMNTSCKVFDSAYDSSFVLMVVAVLLNAF